MICFSCPSAKSELGGTTATTSTTTSCISKRLEAFAPCCAYEETGRIPRNYTNRIQYRFSSIQLHTLRDS